MMLLTAKQTIKGLLRGCQKCGNRDIFSQTTVEEVTGTLRRGGKTYEAGDYDYWPTHTKSIYCPKCGTHVYRHGQWLNEKGG